MRFAAPIEDEMKASVAFLWMICVAILPVAAQDGGKIHWKGKSQGEDLKSIIADAGKEGRAMLFFFGIEGSEACKILNAGIFSDAGVVEASGKVVCIFVNCDGGRISRELIQKYKIESIPAALLAEPDGKEIEAEGTLTAAVLIAAINEVSKKFPGRKAETPRSPASGTSVAEQNDPAATFYRFKIGTTWTYISQVPDVKKSLQAVVKVIEVKPDETVVEVRHFEDGAYDGNRKIQTWKSKDGFLYLDAIPIWKVGSRQGDEWTFRVAGDELHAVHMGGESLQVAAGLYKEAVHVRIRGGKRFEIHTWLAAGVGWVKTEINDPSKGALIMELKDFKLPDVSAPVGDSKPSNDPTPPPKAVTDAEMDSLFFKARLQVAEVHLKSGKKEKAIEILEELIKNYPKSPLINDAQRLLQEARKK